MTFETVSSISLVKDGATGHYFTDLMGYSLTGAEELIRLETRGLFFDESLRPILLGTGPDSYDAKHRLEHQIYQVAIVLPEDIHTRHRRFYENWSNRKNRNYLKSGERFGYKSPLAGLQLRLHDHQEILGPFMAEHDLTHLAVLHEPILDEQGNPISLYVRNHGKPGEIKNILTTRSHQEFHDRGGVVYLRNLDI